MPVRDLNFGKGRECGRERGSADVGASMRFRSQNQRVHIVLEVSKSAGAHSTRNLKISGCRRWCPKHLRVPAPRLTHSLKGVTISEYFHYGLKLKKMNKITILNCLFLFLRIGPKSKKSSEIKARLPKQLFIHRLDCDLIVIFVQVPDFYRRHYSGRKKIMNIKIS